MSLVVVAYDIPHDRRRVKLHTLLLGYGVPVQESVFECDLEEPALQQLRTRISKLLRPNDKVRIYPLCASCAARIENGNGETFSGAPEVYLA